jgi:hypothetical protein
MLEVRSLELRGKNMKKINLSMLLILGIALCWGSSLAVAQKAGYAQQFAILKRMKPELTTIGVIGSTLTEKNIEAITVAAEHTATGTQQIVQTAGDLHQLTGRLDNLLMRFKLTNDENEIMVPKENKNLRKSNLAVRANGKLVTHE